MKASSIDRWIRVLSGACVFWLPAAGSLAAREWHVSPAGSDSADGAAESPLRTIQSASGRAMPGDAVIVHEGVYRERIDPPRGGSAVDLRIVYQAGPGAKVVIKGSELVKGWVKSGHDTWKTVLPNRFFGGFNPYADEIRGDWFNPMGRKHHTGAVYRNGHWLVEAATLEEVMKPVSGEPLWFAVVDENETTIHAQFPGTDPNREEIEINVRQAVFYPSRPGRGFITVRGFTLEHAATNWAPPTAEQVGLIGTHWSKGWIIEDNSIRYSVCTGITLGKHGDAYDNRSRNSAEGYVETIRRGLAAGWSRENIGHHIVRNNHISHCEQAGIVGSLGPAFSMVAGNEIHDIHVRRLFRGAEMAAIKFHGAIDTVIRGNHIHHSGRGIWLDWMTQGTRVAGNLFHDISPMEDLYLEVNHGPFLIDHNLFLSKHSLSDWSQGGAYVHNLFAGKVIARAELGRQTPWSEAHGTAIAGLSQTQGGDNRFFNNWFVAPAGLSAYDETHRPNRIEGNVFFHGAKPSRHESSPVIHPAHDPGIRLKQESGKWLLEIDAGGKPGSGALVTSERLGKASVAGLPFVQPDGSLYRLDRDYHGHPRGETRTPSGPFAAMAEGRQTIHVWPQE